MQQRDRAMMIRLCRKAMLPSDDITSRIGFLLLEGGACGVCYYNNDLSLGKCEQEAVEKIDMRGLSAKKRKKLVCGSCRAGLLNRDWCPSRWWVSDCLVLVRCHLARSSCRHC